MVPLGLLGRPKSGVVSADAVEMMVKRLIKHGQLSAVSVVFDEKTGFYDIIDGSIRVVAMNQLGWKMVRVQVLLAGPSKGERRR